MKQMVTVTKLATTLVTLSLMGISTIAFHAPAWSNSVLYAEWLTVNKFLACQDKMTWNMPCDNETKCFKVFLVFDCLGYKRNARFSLPFCSASRPLNYYCRTHCSDVLGLLLVIFSSTLELFGKYIYYWKSN